jgi:hypothetical protein
VISDTLSRGKFVRRKVKCSDERDRSFRRAIGLLPCYHAGNQAENIEVVVGLIVEFK